MSTAGATEASISGKVDIQGRKCGTSWVARLPRDRVASTVKFSRTWCRLGFRDWRTTGIGERSLAVTSQDLLSFPTESSAWRGLRRT